MVFGFVGHMARCTAPVMGHRTASGAAACPVYGGRYRGYRSYSSPSYSSSESSDGGSGSSARPSWSRPGSSLSYTPAEVRALTPVRDSVEGRAALADPQDAFLCHAWSTRLGYPPLLEQRHRRSPVTNGGSELLTFRRTLAQSPKCSDRSKTRPVQGMVHPDAGGSCARAGVTCGSLSALRLVPSCLPTDRDPELLERFDDLAVQNIFGDPGLAAHEDTELHLGAGVLLLQHSEEVRLEIVGLRHR